MHSKPKYSYRKRGRRWIVYENEYTESTCSGTPIEEYRTPEEARKRVYELNGWRLKEK